MDTSEINEVHVIFKTHLDIGFTDFARNVTKQYFSLFIPKAIETAKTLRQEGKSERFIWTTGSWLIYLYLEQASSKERVQLEEAIMAGDVVWHGLPFTTHSELMDASLFEYGLSLSQELDKRFGKRTIAAKMTDVPGHTRSIVPLLSQAGILFLHIGVNPASTSPDVPPVFVWRDSPNTDVIVMYHKGSYGTLMMMPGMREAIAFAHTNDNLGPQSAEQVIAIFQQLREQFPGARIIASTLDSFASKLMKIKSQLPIIQDEIGDTWIHGVGTDPKKVSQFRELSRLRRQWLSDGKVIPGDKKFSTFSRFLLMIPEHTWGMDEKTHLADYTNYDVAQFRSVRNQAKFSKFEASWLEQRAYLHEAVEALGDSLLADEATNRLRKIEPVPPNKADYTQVFDFATTFETIHFKVCFDSRHGALTYLLDKKTGRNWASPENVLALFHYEIFCEKDYKRFWRQYIINKRKFAHWSLLDFTKQGIQYAVQEHKSWLPRLTAMYLLQDETGHHFLLEMIVDEESSSSFGCPRNLMLEVVFPYQEPIIHLNFQWFNKSACRLPEALWLSFVPRVHYAKKWKIEKMGELISPYEVVQDGNRKLHAVDTEICYSDDKYQLSIETLDAPLVAPGEPSLLNFNNKQPSLKKGMHFNLYNNVWGTNFPMWYDENARFRFVLRVKG